jgi:hypothetical protein
MGVPVSLLQSLESLHSGHGKSAMDSGMARTSFFMAVQNSSLQSFPELSMSSTWSIRRVEIIRNSFHLYSAAVLKHFCIFTQFEHIFAEREGEGQRGNHDVGTT